MNRLRLVVDPPRPGEANMAVDASLLEAHRRGDAPLLRIYRWAPWSVTHGYHQSPEDFDHAVIRDRGYGFARRPTGGRAILHAEELTYAVVADAPSPLFGADLHSAYMAINGALLRFLRDLGLAPDISTGESLAEARGAVCFQSAGRHEVTVGGRKIIGSAQRRLEDRFLQHGSILAGPAHADLLACLAGGLDTPGRRATLLAGTTHLAEQLGTTPAALDYDDLTTRLAEAFAAEFDAELVPTRPV